ncbi:unnamed protein product [Amoebophrya sp. A120]|nr:unnamed protein product [Amoebophrya sp. A120]|eukprot:GSA120T00006956001.1
MSPLLIQRAAEDKRRGSSRRGAVFSPGFHLFAVFILHTTSTSSPAVALRLEKTFHATSRRTGIISTRRDENEKQKTRPAGGQTTESHSILPTAPPSGRFAFVEQQRAQLAQSESHSSTMTNMADPSQCGPWGPLGANLGSWLVLEGWMFSGWVYDSGNDDTFGRANTDTDCWGMAEWQIIHERFIPYFETKLQKGKNENPGALLPQHDEDLEHEARQHALSLLHAHWANFVPEELLDDLHSIGVNVLRIPIGYWLFSEWNDEEAHPTWNKGYDIPSATAAAVDENGNNSTTHQEMNSPRLPPPIWWNQEGFAVGSSLAVLESLLPYFYERCMRVFIDMHAIAGVGIEDQGFAGYKTAKTDDGRNACFYTDCNPFEKENALYGQQPPKIPYGSWLTYMEKITERAFKWINKVNEQYPGLIVMYEALNEPQSQDYQHPDEKVDEFLLHHYYPMVRKKAAEVNLSPDVELVLLVLQDHDSSWKKNVDYLYKNGNFAEPLREWHDGFPTQRAPAIEEDFSHNDNGQHLSEAGSGSAIFDFHNYVNWMVIPDPENFVTDKLSRTWELGNSISGEWSTAGAWAVDDRIKTAWQCGKAGWSREKKLDWIRDLWDKYMTVYEENKFRAHFYWNGRMARDETHVFEDCSETSTTAAASTAPNYQPRYCLSESKSNPYWKEGGDPLWDGSFWCWSLARIIKEQAHTEKGTSPEKALLRMPLPDSVVKEDLPSKNNDWMEPGFARFLERSMLVEVVDSGSSPGVVVDETTTSTPSSSTNSPGTTEDNDLTSTASTTDGKNYDAKTQEPGPAPGVGAGVGNEDVPGRGAVENLPGTSNEQQRQHDITFENKTVSRPVLPTITTSASTFDDSKKYLIPCFSGYLHPCWAMVGVVLTIVIGVLVVSACLGWFLCSCHEESSTSGKRAAGDSNEAVAGTTTDERGTKKKRTKAAARGGFTTDSDDNGTKKKNSKKQWMTPEEFAASSVKRKQSRRSAATARAPSVVPVVLDDSEKEVEADTTHLGGRNNKATNEGEQEAGAGVSPQEEEQRSSFTAKISAFLTGGFSSSTSGMTAAEQSKNYNAAEQGVHPESLDLS